ncbi:MAG: metalloregulator ArsR/SmtB family transcription factor [Kiritimatiellia bacterium]|jgi:rhodanese-related sulfurtransferase
MSCEDRHFKDQIYEHLGRIGKALSSPKRLELLDLLSQGPRTVEVLSRSAGLNLANASKHLQILRAAHLVDAEKRGLFVTYKVGGETVTQFFRALRLLGEERLAEIKDIARRYLEGKQGMEAVDRKQLLKRAREGTVTMLDVRPKEEYMAGHIPGAVSIPLNELQKRLEDLPRHREIAAYCRGPYCVLAVKAVEMLRKKGFRAIRLEDGVPDWRARGFKIAVGE